MVKKMVTTTKKRKRKTGLNSKAKKKEAVARAVIKKGTGKIKVNKRDLSLFEPHYFDKLWQEAKK